MEQRNILTDAVPFKEEVEETVSNTSETPLSPKNVDGQTYKTQNITNIGNFYGNLDITINSCSKKRRNSKKLINEYKLENVLMDLRDWRNLGLELNFSEEILDKIHFECQHEGPQGPSMAFRIIVRWIMRDDKEATVGALDRALKACGYNFSATQLCKL